MDQPRGTGTVQRAFTPNMAGGLTSIRPLQSILCLIFSLKIKDEDYFSERGLKIFFPNRKKDSFPETGRKAIHKSKKESGGDKGPPQAGCSGMRTEMFIMSCSSEGEGGTAAVCCRKHVSAKPHAPDRSLPGETPSRALLRSVDRHPRGG